MDKGSSKLTAPCSDRIRCPAALSVSLPNQHPAQQPAKHPALHTPLSGPVAPASRMLEIDMVRGFALFGVLLVNMYGFGADSIAWDSPADRLVFSITRIFFESKMWTLFSILFGFGFALQLQSTQARGASILPRYLRRLTVLFAIGAAHALLYDGDILMLYAELGLVLLLIRRLSTRTLLVIAVGLILVFPLARLIAGQALQQSTHREPQASISEARAELMQDQLSHVYANGSLTQVLADNTNAIPADPLEDLYTPESGLTVLAMFLIGFSLGRSGVLRNIPTLKLAIARTRAWGLSLGLSAMLAERMLAYRYGYTLYGEQAAGLGVQLAGDLLFSFGATLLALGYAATLISIAQTPRGRLALLPLAGVGRLGLSVYLTQTLIFTTLFYGYGFGQAFRLGPLAVSAWAIAIFVLQVLACQWWLRYFRFGPAEWLWRSLTYLKLQPLRLVA